MFFSSEKKKVIFFVVFSSSLYKKIKERKKLKENIPMTVYVLIQNEGISNKKKSRLNNFHK